MWIRYRHRRISQMYQSSNICSSNFHWIQKGLGEVENRARKERSTCRQHCPLGMTADMSHNCLTMHMYVSEYGKYLYSWGVAEPWPLGPAAGQRRSSSYPPLLEGIALLPPRRPSGTYFSPVLKTIRGLIRIQQPPPYIATPFNATPLVIKTDG